MEGTFDDDEAVPREAAEEAFEVEDEDTVEDGLAVLLDAAAEAPAVAPDAFEAEDAVLADALTGSDLASLVSAVFVLVSFAFASDWLCAAFGVVLLAGSVDVTGSAFFAAGADVFSTVVLSVDVLSSDVLPMPDLEAGSFSVLPPATPDACVLSFSEDVLCLSEPAPAVVVDFFPPEAGFFAFATLCTLPILTKGQAFGFKHTRQSGGPSRQGGIAQHVFNGFAHLITTRRGQHDQRANPFFLKRFRHGWTHHNEVAPNQVGPGRSKDLRAAR